jgi:hypothetical protein
MQDQIQAPPPLPPKSPPPKPLLHPSPPYTPRPSGHVEVKHTRHAKSLDQIEDVIKRNDMELEMANMHKIGCESILEHLHAAISHAKEARVLATAIADDDGPPIKCLPLVTAVSSAIEGVQATEKCLRALCENEEERVSVVDEDYAYFQFAYHARWKVLLLELVRTISGLKLALRVMQDPLRRYLYDRKWLLGELGIHLIQMQHATRLVTYDIFIDTTSMIESDLKSAD